MIHKIKLDKLNCWRGTLLLLLVSMLCATQALAQRSTYGPIQQGETLWSIAESVRPDRTVSVQQTMLALHWLNPNQFIGGNMHRLKKSAILVIPRKDEIMRISKYGAVDEMERDSREISKLRAAEEQKVPPQTPPVVETDTAIEDNPPVIESRSVEKPPAPSVEHDKPPADAAEDIAHQSTPPPHDRPILTRDQTINIAPDTHAGIAGLDKLQADKYLALLSQGWDYIVEVGKYAITSLFDFLSAGMSALLGEDATDGVLEFNKQTLEHVNTHSVWVVGGIVLLVVLLAIGIYYFRQREVLEDGDFIIDDDYYRGDTHEVYDVAPTPEPQEESNESREGVYPTISDDPAPAQPHSPTWTGDVVPESWQEPAETTEEVPQTEYMENDQDMVGMQLDLAKAYIDMEHYQKAREVLNQVLTEGTDSERHKAHAMLKLIE